MTDDLFDVVERLFGIDAELLRKLARERDDNDVDLIDGVFGVDLRHLRDLAERNDIDWDVEADVDTNKLSDGRRHTRGPRWRSDSQPNSYRNSRSEVNTRQNRYSCPTCGRNFLTYRALQRHYDSNPAHAEVEIDVRDIDVDNVGVTGSGWVEFDESIETFVTIPDEVHESDLDVDYDPSREVIEVSGAYDDVVDASEIATQIEGDVSWTIREPFLVISFSKRNSSAS